MKIHSFVALSLVFLQLNFSIFAQEGGDIPARGRDEVIVLGLIWSLPLGIHLAHLINTKKTPRKEKENGGFFSGNFGISKNLKGNGDFPQDNHITGANNSFFSASIGHFSIGRPSNPRYRQSNYELQIDFEYLQDMNAFDSEKVNLLKGFLSNLTGYTSENNAFYVGFGMGGGKLNIHSLLNGDTQLSDTGYTMQLRAGKIFQLPAEELRLNLGYRAIIFIGDIYHTGSHRFEAGLEYKWK